MPATTLERPPSPALSERPWTPPRPQELRAVLRQRFGHADFRGGQRECIERTLSGRHQLMVLPTGGGKSLLYQLPACVLPGATLVVSPLVALMEDQLRGLERSGIPAACLHAGRSASEQDAALRALEAGRLKVLLLAPERLTTARLQRVLGRARISLAAIDEAHCVSEWGHDFRPEYRQLAPILARLDCTVLAITATATDEVQEDVCRSLGVPEAHRTVMGFDRSNLRFGVRRIRREGERLDALAEMAARLPHGCGIVYVTTRVEADDLAFRLCRRLGERVSSYHAGLPPETRAARQGAFLRGELRWLVATNAFGMGIDKPDVRMVLHARPPRSLEDYVQEAGRASRDGRPAVCCMVAGAADVERLRGELVREGLASERAAVRSRRLEAMSRYISTRGCRREEILGYFGSRVERASPRCCDRCHRWRWSVLW
jgi:ATP-dependent DNA helicase RecQ